MTRELYKEVRHEFEIDGRKAFFSIGKLAPRSQAGVYAQMGDTVVLANVNIGDASNDAEFFPLSVEYIEKMYAGGKISGSRFVKRDRFPSDDAILKARMIDRSVRSRFPSDYRDEVSVVVSVLSFDPENDPVLLGINAVSVALMLSSAPFTDPVSAMRIGLKDGELFNMYAHVDRDLDKNKSEMNLVITGDESQITMMDANAYEVSEDVVLDGFEKAMESMKPWIEQQKAFIDAYEAENGEVVKKEYKSFSFPDELLDSLMNTFAEEIKAAMYGGQFFADREKFIEDHYSVEWEGKYSKKQVSDAFEKVAKKLMKKIVLEEKARVDGRGFEEIRELRFEHGILPRTHGSGLFSRGLTQALTIATLGSTKEGLLVDDMTEDSERNYIHYYTAPSYTLGEPGRYRYNPGRREIGHGALAEKALYPVLPSLEEFPYTVILVSEVLSQNGSSSMASTVGSTLALLDAGVPIKDHVAGIALGVIVDDDDPSKFQTLVDIRDVEDFFGEMDYKVTGTVNGVTAIQMDNKRAGLPIEVFRDAMAKSRKARLEIIEKMKEVLPGPKEDVSDYAPKVTSIKIPARKIGELIGPGGKNIKEITEETGAQVDVSDDGLVSIYAADKESAQAALARIKPLAFEPKVGDVYEGKIVSVKDFGFFVEIRPGVDGLVHVSEVADEYVKDLSKFGKEGDTVKVKLIAIDDEGRLKLSMKAV